MVEHCVKNQLIRLRTLGEEAYGITLPQVKIANVISTFTVRWGRIGRLKLSNMRANSSTSLYYLFIVFS